MLNKFDNLKNFLDLFKNKINSPLNDFTEKYLSGIP